MSQNHIDDNDYIFIEYQDIFKTDKKNFRISGIGEKFSSINSFFFEYLREYHIPSAYTNLHSKNSIAFIRCSGFPFTVNVLNTADKRTAKIFGIKQGENLTLPIYEYHYGEGKNSLITESHLLSFDLCSIEEFRIINRMCSKVNAVLKSFFERRDFILSEFFCQFGKSKDKVLVINEFTPRSLKILPVKETKNRVDPYKLITAGQIKKYTDLIFNLTNT